MSWVNYYQSAFNSQKEKLKYWQKYSKFQKVAVYIYIYNGAYDKI